MILNIHGYNSSGNNSKYKFLKEEFPNTKIVSPTFDYRTENPYNILNTLKNRLILNHEEDVADIIVGSSMGGFFAYCLCAMYDIRTILINPSLMPFINLNTKYHVGNTICKKYIELLAKYANDISDCNIDVIVSDNDSAVNHNETTRAILSSKKFILVKGEHHLEMTDELKSLIKKLILQ